ncbi:MAG: hypothetical protein MJK18_15885 [Bdellovibrionales bacterium]|nr:hypothetical protein [Bdellovibrionales bacterium]
MYSRSRDLILVSLFGFIYYAIVVGMNGHLTKIPSGEYFLAPFALSILMGIAISYSGQIMEWPLCFMFGGSLGSVTIIGVLNYLGMEFTMMEMAKTVVHTLSWYGLLAAMMMVGILIGYFLKLTFNVLLGSLKMSA